MNQATKTPSKAHLVINGLNFYFTIDNSIADDKVIESHSMENIIYWASRLQEGFNTGHVFNDSGPKVECNLDSFYNFKRMLQYWVQEENYEFNS